MCWLQAHFLIAERRLPSPLRKSVAWRYDWRSYPCSDSIVIATIMSDRPTEGNEPRNSKRPANVVRVSAEELDEAPPSKRSKPSTGQQPTAQINDESTLHVFHSRIFVSLVPDAWKGGRFVLPEKSSFPSPSTQSLFCVTLDLNEHPNIVTIKKRINLEHGM